MVRKVLFLCTGNSCRSRMAEAIVNARLSNDWRAFSAGTEPSGYVHPNAIQVLDEIGITHNGESKNNDQLRDTGFDLVGTVCDNTAENCPIWLGKGKRIHLGFPDPAKATVTDEDQLAVFRSVRDAIAKKVPEALEQM